MTKKLENRPIAADEHKGIVRRDFLKAALLSTAIAGGVSCAHNGPTDSVPPRTPQVSGNSSVLQGGRYSGGQIQIAVERVAGDPVRVRAVANISPETRATYYWFVYQEMGDGKQYVLNPVLSVASAPRYVGIVMQDVTLTDGTRGDFVVKVHGNATRPASVGSEWDPAVESDGRVRPENVLYQVRTGTLEPVVDDLLNSHLDLVSRQSASPAITVPEYGPTTPVLIVSSY
jgi:hypothetical protein